MSVGRRTAGKSWRFTTPAKPRPLLVPAMSTNFRAVEQVDQHLVANFHAVDSRRPFTPSVADAVHHNALDELHRRKIVLLEVALHRLGQARVLHKLNQPDLGGVVAVVSAVFNWVMTQGPACSTVTGRTSPLSSNSCVMPDW